jgi:ferredoxin
VLQSTFAEFGIDGLFIPKMNFDVNYCQYECNLCGNVCPTGAIKPFELEVKKTIQMGKVTFVKDNCVVSQLEKDCGACAEHCPTKAVRMVPYEGKSGKKLFIPEVNTDICIGCGACEHPCPVRPHKAIYVESNPHHLVAQKPKIEKVEQTEGELEEFPF